jgi:hypothetical protein
LSFRLAKTIARLSPQFREFLSVTDLGYCARRTARTVMSGAMSTLGLKGWETRNEQYLLDHRMVVVVIAVLSFFGLR